ncbi:MULTISPECIES: 3-hydroxyacyl-ACP dehydratase FabZ family protein [Bacillus]|uniref:Beta-hydroxyacyl-ACP dehydratase n=2 Tax=Bacillus TaxID=1386 RepID=A0A0M4GCS1_9BACI|nr:MULTISPECIES: 3-hydroxyacyl-ACP dehydratase FabZ family protein [Bacillus]ALC83758.1 hypothetical protein AM592_21230 [Bacillus gobiensis]MBP1083978.1 3-hydroxyacyl-[acyl-carrier-protein] dehydratase [Bacillus capparidis]MED1096976.1 beta-hydroxyacyl-ACP dehydratase [Bacillus capparidis]
MNKLPHQYPFLFIDRVVEVVPGKSALGYKYISNNDWFLISQNGTMPFGLIIEALAQLSAYAAAENNENSLGLLSSIKNASREGDVHAGDRLDLFFEVIRFKKGFLFGTGTASVNGNKIAKADIGIYISH